ncbi:MAG: ImmA/IrrE family metallo-endopeptidase [Gemmataceae bacterium]|nr:ImmA/IrrE family metallo-endopeptidase [Gemmataceae bacterium]
MDHFQAIEVIDSLVLRVLAEHGVERPPVDAVLLAAMHIGEIVINSKLTTRGHIQEVDGAGSVIAVRPERHPERHHWTVAHELSESLKDEFFDLVDAGEDRHPQAAERMANVFASRLLVPTAWLERDAYRCGFELPAIKRIYATASNEVIAMRLLDLAEPSAVAVFDHGRLVRRRSNVGHAVLTEAEKECQAAVHRTGERQQVRCGGIVAVGWPVNEDGWKREILRATPADE